VAYPVPEGQWAPSARGTVGSVEPNRQFELQDVCGKARHAHVMVAMHHTRPLCAGLTGHGGFEPLMRAPGDFAYKIPDALDSASAAPLLCAGITVRREQWHNHAIKIAVVVLSHFPPRLLLCVTKSIHHNVVEGDRW